MTRGPGRTAALTAVLVLWGCGGDDPPTSIEPPPPGVVTMTNNTFTPFTTTIRAGESVTFDFPPFPHNVIFKDRAQHPGAPADIPATSNQKVLRVFAAAGTFPYDCTLHPGMSGQVIVNP